MKKLVVALLLVMLAATPAMAGCEMVDEWANSDSYVTKVPGMLLRGTMNVLAVPGDLIMGIVHGTMERPPVVGTVVGLLTGVQDGLDRTGRILADVVGAPFPAFNGFGDYKACPFTGTKLGSSKAAA